MSKQGALSSPDWRKPTPWARRPGWGSTRRSAPAASKHVVAQRKRPQMPVGHQQGQCYRQVKAPRVFRQIGRCQVDRDPWVVWERQTATQQRAAHPLAGFANLGVGQSNQLDRWQAWADLNFDLDPDPAHSDQGAIADACMAHRGVHRNGARPFAGIGDKPIRTKRVRCMHSEMALTHEKTRLKVKWRPNPLARSLLRP